MLKIKRVNIMEKQFLKECLEKGMSTRQIAALPDVNITSKTICYYIHKYELEEFMKYKKPKYDEQYFDMIDTKEKAYILGYCLADGYISDKSVEFGCALEDKEILDFISKEFGAKVQTDTYFNKKSRRFPRARINIGNPKIVKTFNKYCGQKEEKTFPRIKKELQHYMLLGFFDGDGCLTFGHRKDRDRVWQKVNFTGSYKLLYSIQKSLEKANITSSLRPKQDENCFVIELSSKDAVLKVLKYIYGEEDLIVLHRKYKKYVALRLELGENEETTQMSTISCQAVSHETEGVETIGEKMDSLNNRLERPSLNQV